MKTSRRPARKFRQSQPEQKLQFGGDEPPRNARSWTELRIRRAELVKDNVTLPIQRLREAVSDLIKLSEDKDIGQELVECNRRLAELREEVKAFLEQSAPDHVYWVERSGKAHKNLALNAAPIDVADFLRRRLFESDTSIIMTSATLGNRSAGVAPAEAKAGKPNGLSTPTTPQPRRSALTLFRPPRRRRIRHATPGRHAVRLRAADEDFRRQKNARPARGRLRRRAWSIGSGIS